jgi:DNA-binding transcriptional regulator YiaG
MVMEKYQSEFLGSLHETALGLHKIGVIDDAEMQEYDRDCLVREDKTLSSETARKKSVISAYASGKH